MASAGNAFWSLIAVYIEVFIEALSGKNLSYNRNRIEFGEQSDKKKES
jgi:hypothetical protein